MKKILNWLKSSSSDFVLFLLLLVLLNIAGFNAFKRFDLTQPKSYSLSKASQNLVKNLNEPLAIRVFFDKNLPAPYNSVAQYVEDFLDEYKSAANKKFSVSYMDMNKEENMDIADDFGLRQIQIQEVKNNEVGFRQAYMGLVISYGDTIEKIDPITTTEGFEYTLTSAITRMMNTADALSGLKGDDKIKVSVYITEPLKNLGIAGCDQLESVMSAAFAEVNKQRFNRLDYKIIHPVGEEAESVIEHYGIQSIAYPNEKGEREIGAFGVVVEYEDNFRVLPILIQQSFFGYSVSGYESAVESLNNGIQSLMAKPTQIGYIMGHGEINPEDEQTGKSFASLITQSYDLKAIDLLTMDIPAGMNSIIINGPKGDFEDIELYKIDQYLMRGGNLILFMDALVNNPDRNSDMAMLQNTCNLDNLLKKYGIEREFNVVLDEQCYETSSNQMGKINMYWGPLLQKKQMNAKHPITSNLGYILMYQTGSINAKTAMDDPNVKVTVIAKSSDKSWLGDEYTILHPLTVNPPRDKSQYKAENLVVLCEGKFESAFEESPVQSYNLPNMPFNTAAPDFVATNHIANSRLPGKIIIAGTSQITTRSVLGGEANLASNPVAMFEANILDYMNGNEDLCRMRTKGLVMDTLTIKSGVFAKIAQYFNEFGLSVLVVLIGFIVWRMRARRKTRINAAYNPDDQRTMEKKSKKSEKKEKEERGELND